MVRSCCGPENQAKQNPDHEADPVANCKHHRVIMHLAAIGQVIHTRVTQNRSKGQANQITCGCEYKIVVA